MTIVTIIPSIRKKKIEHLSVSKHHNNQWNEFGLGVKDLEKWSDEQKGAKTHLKRIN